MTVTVAQLHNLEELRDNLTSSGETMTLGAPRRRKQGNS